MLSPSPGGSAKAGQTEGHTDTGTEAQVRVTQGVWGDPCMAPMGLRTPSWGCAPGGQLLFLASGDLALTPVSGQQEGSLVGAGRCPGEAPRYALPVPRSMSSAAVSAQALRDLSPESMPLSVSSSIAAGFRIFHIFHLKALPPHHPRWMLSSERVSTRKARPCRGVCFLFGGAGICSSCVNPEVVMSPVRKHSCGFLACALVPGPPSHSARPHSREDLGLPRLLDAPAGSRGHVAPPGRRPGLQWASLVHLHLLPRGASTRG